MDTLRQSLRKFSQAFLPINPFAGKLRALLVVLLFFILWTLNAQNRSLPEDGFILLQPEGGFIVHVLLDLAGRYFHPGTLWLTFTPAILFLLARKQTASLLGEMSSSGVDTAQRFLDRCAFSFGMVSVTASDLHQQDFDQKALAVHKFGGPAQVAFSAEDFVIVQSMAGDQYQLVQCNSKEPSCTLVLPHQQSIAGVIPAANLMLKLPSADITQSLLLRLRDEPSMNAGQDEPIIFNDISKGDAQFLLETRKPEMVILPLLRYEIQRYQNAQVENPYAPQAESLPRITLKVSQNIKKHSDYAKPTASLLPRKRWFSRPRKHSLYVNTFTGGEDAMRKTKPPDNEFLIGLEAHLQREMVSFFNLEKIQITLTNRG